MLWRAGSRVPSDLGHYVEPDVRREGADKRAVVLVPLGVDSMSPLPHSLPPSLD